MYRFLTIDNVQYLHAKQIERFGGEDGLRDLPLLDSAVAMPQAGMGGAYLHEDIFAMAAAYLYHIVMNHPFVDGNKRTGLNVALFFLRLNKYRLKCDKELVYDMTLNVACGKLDKDGVASFFRENCVPL